MLRQSIRVRICLAWQDWKCDMDFSSFINLQKAWSQYTFGKGKRTEGLAKHIQSELDELLKADNDMDRLEEFIDIVILAMDGAWRLGFYPDEIEKALIDKFIRNQRRQWPKVEVSEADQDEPTFHVKE